MRHAQVICCFIFSAMSLGAGPNWHEPVAYTGEAVERAIADAYRDPRGRVFLPGGVYRITRTIQLNAMGPMIIEGATQGAVFKEWNHPSSVRLEWYGPAGQPMVRMNSLGVQLRNLMLDGRGVASHGVVLTNKPQAGSALNRLEDVTLNNFTVACFQAGEDPGDANCADGYFDRVAFFRAPVGFKSINDQSVNHQFNGCNFTWLQVALDIDRGGAISVFAGGAQQCDLLVRVRRGGHSTGAIHIGPIKVEKSGYKNKYMSLVDARNDPPNMNAVLDAGQIRLVSLRMGLGMYPEVPDNMEIPLFRIGPGAQVVAEGCLFHALGDTSQWPLGYVQGKQGVGYASFVARDTIWFGGKFEPFITNEWGRVELLGPTDNNARRFPNFIRGVGE